MGDSANIIVGTAGKAYAAPVGTTFPAGPEVAWPSGFADMGFITPDGLEEAMAEERTQLDAWGEDAPVVDLAKKRTQTFKLTFRETTARILSLYYQVQMANMTSTAAAVGPRRPSSSCPSGAVRSRTRSRSRSAWTSSTAASATAS